jgi:uncharacterized protein (TIGR02996 family)
VAEQTDLLEACLAESNDDEPRHVYADWLEQHGDPRGEFIALQLLEARGAATPKHVRRAKKLLTEHRAAWLGPELAAAMRIQKFERGFLVAVTILQAAVVQDAASRASPELWFIQRLEGEHRVLQLASGMRSLETLRLFDESELLAAIERREPHSWRHVSTGPELTREPMLSKAVASPGFRRVPHLIVWVWPDSLQRLVALAKQLGWPNKSELAKLTLTRGAGFPDDAGTLRAYLLASGVTELAREVTSTGTYGDSVSLTT